MHHSAQLHHSGITTEYPNSAPDNRIRENAAQILRVTTASIGTLAIAPIDTLAIGRVLTTSEVVAYMLANEKCNIITVH